MRHRRRRMLVRRKSQIPRWVASAEVLLQLAYDRGFVNRPRSATWWSVRVVLVVYDDRNCCCHAVGLRGNRAEPRRRLAGRLAEILPTDYLDFLSVDKRDTMWQSVVERGSPRLLVARTAEQLVGWIAFGGSRDEGVAPDCGEIWAIPAAPPAWSMGVGRSLL